MRPVMGVIVTLGICVSLSCAVEPEAGQFGCLLGRCPDGFSCDLEFDRCYPSHSDGGQDGSPDSASVREVSNDGADCLGGICCGRMCRTDTDSADDACGELCSVCDPSESCIAGTCTCREGLMDCNDDGTCETNTRTDRDNCAMCSLRCAGNESCIDGECGTS